MPFALLVVLALAAPPPGFTPVTPLTRPAGAASLPVHQGRFFAYALPDGWQVAEDGQFALTLVAADRKALTVMVGNAGVPPGTDPGEFARRTLGALRPEGLALGPARPGRPLRGFQSAVQHEVRYAIGGVPCQGLATVHLLPAYDSVLMVMTAALSEAAQWPRYAGWLPAVAEQVSATSGAAFGRRGLMAQNLRNSTAYAEAARSYREWSQRTQQEVSAERDASSRRRNEQFRETSLGGERSYSNPYDASAPVKLPLTYGHYWVDEHGTVLGTNDGSADPNQGSTHAWRRMSPRAP